ncbi:MAG: type II/IV secretion system protein [Acidobacteria bacterium]|nr:MAG: type II/IV secretion system protein [Acidobacteriota bacterium]REK01016.1 MAG: type II/IV secretion system protein [Acidobacteriota bacterium]
MLTPQRLTDILLRQGLILPEEAQIALREARDQRRRDPKGRTPSQRSTGYELIERMQFQNRGNGGKPLTEADIAAAVAKDAGLPLVKIDPLRLDVDLIESKISRPFAIRHRMLPLRVQDGRLVVACADPGDLEAVDSFRRLAGQEVDLVVASEPDIVRAITEFYGLRRSVKQAEVDLTAGVDLGNLEALVRMKSETEIESSDQHIVNAVEFMLQHAYDTRASDIHLEPKRDISQIRFRIDGVLHEIQTMPRVVHRAVVSRIKTMARMDIAEKRRPQDGRIKTLRRDQEIELRVSTLPVAFGEKAVLRIFDPDNFMRDLTHLGFEPEEHDLFNGFIQRPHGIILVTGPTGSGKSTTLYSALGTLARPDINITTIEDPIEMVHPVFNQVAVQVKAGVTFASALRHILRQDPDVIMVGEIRDGETAQYAMQAAMTGHLVFSTLHTNDASSSIGRLKDLGIESYMISSTLVGSMAQRLVRKICEHCSEDTVLSSDQAAALSLTVPEGKQIKVRQGSGCGECRGTGYLGRTGVFEILQLDDAIKHHIQQGADSPVIKREAVKNGMRTLRQSALRKLAAGVTTFEEVVRVTGLA